MYRHRSSQSRSNTLSCRCVVSVAGEGPRCISPATRATSCRAPRASAACGWRTATWAGTTSGPSAEVWIDVRVVRLCTSVMEVISIWPPFIFSYRRSPARMCLSVSPSLSVCLAEMPGQFSLLFLSRRWPPAGSLSVPRRDLYQTRLLRRRVAGKSSLVHTLWSCFHAYTGQSARSLVRFVWEGLHTAMALTKQNKISTVAFSGVFRNPNFLGNKATTETFLKNWISKNISSLPNTSS